MATREQIDLLRLAPRAKAGARLLNERCPYVEFTSGSRSVAEQARVMAVNEWRAPGWIGATYRRGADLADSIRVNRAQLRAEADLRHWIERYLSVQSEEWLSGLSRHLTGYAFDVRPVIDDNGHPTAKGWAIIDCARRDIGAENVLLREGGLVIWHVQFTPTEEV
jgi:hypothetical protein